MRSPPHPSDDTGLQKSDAIEVAKLAGATERLKIRAAIDAEGLKALQLVAGGGSVALAQFYLTALQHGPDLRGPIAIAFSFNMLALILSLLLHRFRRETSLLHEGGGDRQKAARGSSRDKWVWHAAVASVAMGLIWLAISFVIQSTSSPAHP